MPVVRRGGRWVPIRCHQPAIIMNNRRLSLWGFLFVLGAFGLAACEPYMSMTDQLPVQARRAATLLPEQPRYVGMVNIETVFQQVGDLRNQNFADSLRQTDHPLMRAFMDATGMDPNSDLNVAYGALEGNEAFSVVLFADLAPEQLDRYLDRAPRNAGRTSTYQGRPVYHLTLGEREASSSDTLTVAFVDEGTLAVSNDVERVRAMVDRHQSAQGTNLLSNDTYMDLVKRVGRGNTAWLVGRDVVEAALQDSSGGETAVASVEGAPPVNQAGLQNALSEWSDRVLGLSEVSAIGGRASAKFGQLKSRLQDQAISITLTETALEGQVYLTMRDNASASSVVDVAEGAVAMLKLSGDNLDERHRDLLDEVTIERDGPIVHVQFSLDRGTLQNEMRAERERPNIRRADSPVRPVISSIRRTGSIK